MNRKFYFSFLVGALALAVTVAIAIGSRAGRAAAPNTALSALPASDFIISVDVQRALSETFPTLLASNPAELSKFNAALEEFQQKTGINPRVFESIAIGGSLNPNSPPGRHDQNAVVIARGSFNANQLLDSAFTAAQKDASFDKEEQQYEGKTIFLISNVRRLKKETDKEPAPAIQSQPSGNGGGVGPSRDATLSTRSSLEVLEGPSPANFGALSHGPNNKFAVAAVDANTIAIGSPESVRAAIDASLGRNRVDDELVRQASQSPTALIGFSGKLPSSFAGKQTTDNPVARYMASVRGYYGSFNSTGSSAEALVTLRTETAEQANDMSQAINSLKSLATIGFGQSAEAKTPQGEAFSEFIKSLTITSQNNEVQLSARFPLPTVAPFVKHF